MKKLLLSFAILAAAAAVAQAQQRLVLYEEFTGENCGPCAAANPGLEDLMAAGTNPDKVVHLTYMEPIPTPGYFYYSQQSLYDYRMVTFYSYVWTKFGYFFTPSGIMDGLIPDSTTSSPASVPEFSQADIDAEAAIPSKFNIDAAVSYNNAHDSMTVNITITALQAVTANMRLFGAYIKTMDFKRPPGVNGETHFENVVRTFFPTNAGTLLPATWTAGEIKTYTLKGKISALDTFTNVTSSNENAVVWIQNSNDKVVQQVAKGHSTTGIKEAAIHTSDMAIYPNPANATTTISFTLDQVAPVHLQVVDMSGRLVANINEGNIPAGRRQLTFNTAPLAAGMYNITVIAGNSSATQRLSVVK